MGFSLTSESHAFPNPISIDISRAFASAGDPLTATRDTRHGAYDPHDAISSASTSFAENSQPRSPTTGVGLARVRGGPGGVPFILRLRCAAFARGRWRPRRTDGPRRSRPLTRRRRRILRRHRRDTVARRALGGVSSRASATSRHARVFSLAMRQGFSPADAPAREPRARRELRARPR